MKNSRLTLYAQQGMVTLAMSMVVLFISSIMVFYSSSGALFEIKSGNNQVYQTRALESARGAIEMSMAWLADGSNTSSLAWVSDGSGPYGNNEKADSTTFPALVSNQTIGGHAVAVSLWRNSAASSVLEVSAVAAGDATASVRQKIQIGTTLISTPNTLVISNVAPIVINGGLSGVTGRPDVYPNTVGGTAIATSVTNPSLIDTGHLNLHGGTVSLGAFTGSAWDYIFPTVTKAQMKAAAQAQAAIYASDPTRVPTIWYYDAPLANNNWHLNLGSASAPVILVFDEGTGCPTINGTVTIYGLVYYDGSCTDNGWGGANIYGSLVSDQSITKLNANADFYGWSINSGSGVVTLPTNTVTTGKTFAKLAASWRDF